MARVTDKALCQRVIAPGNARLASSSSLSGCALLDKAHRFGVPLETTMAEDIAGHFVAKREAILTYRR
jgi:hypothetical protein